jgi:expansin (peptidoglycan-binding protein)
MPWPSSSQPQSGVAMYTALSTNLYDGPAGSASCGKCVQVNGKTLIVVDQCPFSSSNPGLNPTCSTSHLDLGGQATYQSVAGNSGTGMVANNPGVAVKFVPCPVTGNIQYAFTTSTQQFYLAMVVLNAKYGVQKVDFRASGTCNWTAMTGRTDADPHWIISTGTIPNPIDFRVTDEWGHVVVDDGVRWTAGQSVSGTAQFQTCP